MSLLPNPRLQLDPDGAEAGHLRATSARSPIWCGIADLVVPAGEVDQVDIGASVIVVGITEPTGITDLLDTTGEVNQVEADVAEIPARGRGLRRVRDLACSQAASSICRAVASANGRRPTNRPAG